MMPQSRTGVKRLLSYVKRQHPELEFTETFENAIEVSFNGEPIFSVYFDDEGTIYRLSLEDQKRFIFIYGDYLDYIDEDAVLALFSINEDDSPDAEDRITGAIRIEPKGELSWSTGQKKAEMRMAE